MRQQPVLIPLRRQDRVLPISTVPEQDRLIDPVRAFHSIHADGATAQIALSKASSVPQQSHETQTRGDFSIDTSVTQESFRIETHVGLHYNRGYSQ